MFPLENYSPIMLQKILSLYCLFFYFFSQTKAQTRPEFRGVWVATVDNIDWPKQGDFNTDSQKASFIRLLDMHQRNGINALVVQIRPCTDAFYPSQYEPWSQWLTGVQGRPPSPYYDPLEFMIAETHKRKMVFHAWMNPYRAVFNVNETVTAAAPTGAKGNRIALRTIFFPGAIMGTSYVYEWKYAH